VYYTKLEMNHVGTTDCRGDATNGSTGELKGNSVDRAITMKFNFLSAFCFHFNIPGRDIV
jgi:hypothetical protein